MKVQRSALLPYSAAQMFAIINDVRAYPEFLNGCDSAQVLEESAHHLIAKLKITYAKLSVSFTTKNQLKPAESIDMQLVEGPFKNLHGQWHIKSLSDAACKVSLSMDFSFDSAITQRMFGKMFQSVVSAQVDAFEKRANDIYQNA